MQVVALRVALPLLAGLAAAMVHAAPHPRIWVTPDVLPRLRAMASDTTPNALGCVPAEAWERILRRAQQLADAGPYHYSVMMPGAEGAPPKLWEYTLSDQRPPRHDDYPHYPPTTALFQERDDSISTRLKYFLTAWLVTGESMWYEKAREIVFHLCAWQGAWNDATAGEDRAGLDTSHAATWVGIFYDWCYDQLSPAERDLVRTCLVDKALTLLAVWGAKGAAYHNITVRYLVGLGVGSIAIMDEEPRTAQWLELVISRLRENFDAQGVDGGSLEGPMYGDYAVSGIADFLWALDSAGVPHDLLQHRYLQTMPRYCITLLDPGTRQQPCFGDGGPFQGFGTLNLALALRGDTEAAYYCDQIGLFSKPEPRVFLGMDPERIRPQRPAWNPSGCFVDVGYAVLRDGFNPQAAFMGFKCGPPDKVVGHNHFDHNSFVISYAGSWVASDPGYRDYFHPARRKYTVSSLGHNTIVLDLDEQYLADTNYRNLGHEQVNLAGGRIREFIAGERYDYLLGDAAAAYNDQEQVVLQRFDRQVVFVKPNVFLMRDTLVAPHEHSFCWLLHTSADNVIRVDGGAAQAVSSSCLLQVHPFSPDGITLTSASYPGAESRGPYLAAQTGRSASTVITTALIPRPHRELITNGGFEDGMVGWTPRSAEGQLPNHVIDTEVAHSGRASGRIDNNGYYYTRPFHLPPGTTITVRWWAKATAPGARGYIYHSADGQSVKRTELPGPTSDEWTQFEVTDTVPPGATQTRVALEMFVPPGVTGQCWYDDLQIEAQPALATAPPATVSALDAGATGVVVEVDGMTHIMVCGAAGEMRTVQAAGHAIGTDAELAVVTLGDGPPRGFVLRGATLTVDGRPAQVEEGEWRVKP